MSETRSELALERLLVVLEPSNPSRQPLAAARELAQSFQLELAGLFVENLNLLRLAALPITREVGAVSGVVRAIDVIDVERALRAQAQQLRGLFSSLAAELDLPWSFRVERGELLERVLAELSETVAAVFAPAARSAQTGTTTRVGAGAARTRRVLAILDPTAAGSRAVSVAQRLSLTRGASMAVAVVSAESAGLGALREMARKRVPAVATDAALVRLADTSVGALADAARMTACDVLVLGSAAFPRQQREFRALLERVRCPVVLVG
ncbi:MAG TPA: universal stress protein [Burkholderiales bacterium]|nr:universal stress protein [Burkholderiales bacterium]